MTTATPPPAGTPPPAKTEEQRQADAVAAAEAHRASVAAAAAAKPEVIAGKPERPEGVPEKFWNAETGAIDYKAWGAAHSSLETKFHESKAPPKPESPPANETPEQKAAREAAAAAPPATREAAVAAAQAEYAKDGKLSDASYTALAAQGYDRSMVDTYIAGQTAKASELTTAAHGATEGAENYGKMVEWAAENLSEAEIKAYNAQLATNDPAVIKAAVAGVYSKYKAVAPVEGNRLGGGAPPSNSSMFMNKDEHRAAMREPSKTQPGKTRYETDAAYRQEVINKLNASRKAGVSIF